MLHVPSFSSWVASVLNAGWAHDGGTLAVALAAPFADEHLWLWRNLVVVRGSGMLVSCISACSQGKTWPQV